jgi:hypothetical protein
MGKNKELITKEQGINIARFLMNPEIDSDIRKSVYDSINKSKSITNKEREKITDVHVEGAPAKNLSTLIMNGLRF